MTDSTLSVAPHARALVLFGSETGNSEDVARQVQDVLERLHFSTRTAELDSINLVCTLGIVGRIIPSL